MSLIRNTLFYQYIKERNGQEIIEDENGFLVFKINGEECFIVDMFVSKDVRQKKHGSNLLNKLTDVANKNQCKVITANIHLWDAGHSVTVQGALRHGFKIIKSSNDVLLVAKNLEA